MRDDKQRTTRVWGSLTNKVGTTPVTSTNIEMNIWNTGWANPLAMYNQGYKLINTEDSQLYIVPLAGYYYDYLNSKSLYENWEVNKFGNGTKIPAGSEQMIGGMFAVWNDMIDKKSNGITEYDIFDRVLPAAQALSEKMWGRGKDKTYDQFKEVASKVSLAPNINPTSTVKSITEKVIQYNLDEAVTSLKDTSGNNYNVVKSENVTSVTGKTGKALSLKGGTSYIQSPITNMGPNYTVSMWVKRDTASDNSEQVLFESEKGSFKAVQKDTGKVGFSREFYDYSFDYELPKDKWVQLSIVGQLNKTTLYVNGEEIDTIGAGSGIEKIGTFVFPLEIIGSKTKAFNGLVDDVVVSNVKTITDATIIPQSQMTATTTSFQPNTANEGEARYAIDGNEASMWHTKWSEAVLPQSITLALGGSYEINKFSYLPRQSGTNGIITQYEISVSTDGEIFTKVSEGSWANNNSLKRVEFTPVTATHIRLTAKAAVGNFASAAELNVNRVIKNNIIYIYFK